jgi:poly-gamma-glutamate capsule biosynthesis protein CapA/YwtB (metallophosphatase superfamily)
LYFAAIDPGTGALAHLQMVPMQARQIRLRPAAVEDAEYLARLIERISRRRVDLADGSLWLGTSA